MEEEQQLVATAGGMSKGATIGVAVAGTVAVLGISGLVGNVLHRRNTTRAANAVRERAEQMLTVKKKMLLQLFVKRPEWG